MGYSWDPQVESYRGYLGRRSVLDEQVQGMRGAADAQLQGMRQTASEICSGISSQTRELLGSVESLTASLSADLEAMTAGIESGLGHLAGVLNTGFAGLLRKSDEIKQELQRLVELVELEEQCKAMENFRYAVFARNRGLWDEALGFVTAAIEGDAHSKGYKLDWHFHWVKGELLLGNPARSDWPGVAPAEAEQAFLLASRYGRADAPTEAAKAMLMASVAAYAQSQSNCSKLTDMCRHAEAAHTLDRGLTEAAFQLSKARMALGDPENALPVLRKAIDTDLAFAVRAAEDPDHRRHEQQLNAFFDALRREKAKEIAQRALAALQPLEALVAKSPEFASGEAIEGLRRAASGKLSGGLVELLAYGASGLERDVAATRLDVRRRQNELRVSQAEQERVETYHEQVEVEPAGWFRSAVFKTVERTRKVKSVQVAVMDGFGEAVRSVRPGAMMQVPAGLFLMGESGKQHTVELTRGFAIGVAPVTQKEYEALMGANPSKFKGLECPVEQVSWFDAVQFCNATSRAWGFEESYVVQGDVVQWKASGCRGFRLPTEAEWEYACWAGTTDVRYGPAGDVAWTSENAGQTTHPVGQKMPNAWGLYDTLGNVWEWCWDWYGDYAVGTVSNPTGPRTGSRRVFRGGSWLNDADYAVAADRNNRDPGYRSSHLGFRLARSLP